jgi:hypothetical protein
VLKTGERCVTQELYGFLLRGDGARPLNAHDAVRIPASLLQRVGVSEDCVQRGVIYGSDMHVQAGGAPSWALLLVLRLNAEAPHTRALLMSGAAMGERWSVAGDIHALQCLSRTCRSLLDGGWCPS